MFYVLACVYAILPNQTNFGRKIGQMRNPEKFEEARRDPEKKMKTMSGRKVPFREQALPTIALVQENYGLYDGITEMR